MNGPEIHGGTIIFGEHGQRGYRRELDQNPVHLGDKALLDDKVADIPRSIRAPAVADKWLVVGLVKDSVGYKKLRHEVHDLRK